MMKKGLFFLFVLLLLASGFYLRERFAEGFSYHNITSSLTFNPAYSIDPIAQEKREELKNLLNQPFHYIGKGCQFYVFMSEDKRAVIKFMKHKHLRPLNWQLALVPTQVLKNKLRENVKRREERISNLFSSIKLGYEEMADEAAIIHIHLNRISELNQKVTLVDKLGMVFHIDVDDHEYIIQKRAFNVKEVIATLVSEGDETAIRRRIRELVDIVAERCDKGIQDRDRTFVQNVAFKSTGEGALFIDIGQFYKTECVKKTALKKREILHRLKLLRTWMKRYFPTLVPLVDDEIEKRS